MSGLWGWVRDSHRTFRQMAQQGDADRAQLVRLYRDILTEPLTILITDPTRAFTMLSQGREIAERIEEPGWMVLLDHWRTRALRSAGQFRLAQEIALSAALYSRKPPFNQFPQRFCIQLEDVVGVSMRIDPEGFEPQINAALEYVEAGTTPGLECSWCLPINRGSFAEYLGQYGAARKYALQALSLSGGIAYREAQVYYHLCFIAAEGDDWQTVRSWAIESEASARRSKHPEYIADALFWQALVARWEGDEQTARRQYREAEAQIRPYPDLAHIGVYQRCRYHEAGGELACAVAIREQQIARIAGQGLFFTECTNRLAHCRLLLRLGQSIEREKETFLQVAQGLRHPESMLQRLERLET
jgi:hypothetical protein